MRWALRWLNIVKIISQIVQGNKGGVCVRWALRGVSLCVVNSHLAPHEGAIAERVANYNAIIDRTVFPGSSPTTAVLFHECVIIEFVIEK